MRQIPEVFPSICQMFYVRTFVKGVQEQTASNQRCEMQIQRQVSAGRNQGNILITFLMPDGDLRSRVWDDLALRWVMAMSDNQPDALKKRNTPPMWSFMSPENLNKRDGNREAWVNLVGG